MDDRTYNLWQCVVEVADPEGKTFWHPQVRRGVTGDIAVRRAVDDVQPLVDGWKVVRVTACPLEKLDEWECEPTREYTVGRKLRENGVSTNL